MIEWTFSMYIIHDIRPELSKRMERSSLTVSDTMSIRMELSSEVLSGGLIDWDQNCSEQCSSK